MRLHRTQKAFRQSASLYRGFVGGRGSGKSWVGAYDMIRRARRGRLYLVASPTYTILADTTFRTFRKIAGDLGQWDDGSAQVLASTKSHPPAIHLTTGAEIVFRSADDPEKLRGPNLSGVWLDEASLMHRDAYEIAIGCLREGGEQGWLSATFTPAGLTHWTYDIFGGDKPKPNTAIFTAHTRDNPFNPRGFADTLAGQYSPQRARQELGGEFVSLEGAEWPPEYFPESLWFADWPGVGDLATSALALDPSLGVGERAKGCFATFVYGALDRRGVLWVEAWMSQDWDGQRLAEQAIDLHQRLQPKAFLFESNGGQAFLGPLFLQSAKSKGFGLPLYRVNNVEKKEERIRGELTPRLAKAELRFRDTPGTRKLMQQLRDFPMGEYVDGPDALAMLTRMIQWILTRPRGAGQPEVVTR